MKKKFKICLQGLSALILAAAISFAACSGSSSSSDDAEPPSSQGQTQQTGCASNSDCPEGYVCNSYGECVREVIENWCEQDSDCPSSGRCIEHRCLYQGCISLDEDGRCVQCAEGYILDGGDCVASF